MSKENELSKDEIRFIESYKGLTDEQRKIFKLRFLQLKKEHVQAFSCFQASLCTLEKAL